MTANATAAAFDALVSDVTVDTESLTWPYIALDDDTHKVTEWEDHIDIEYKVLGHTYTLRGGDYNDFVASSAVAAALDIPSDIFLDDYQVDLADKANGTIEGE